MLIVDAFNVLHTQGVLPRHLAGLEVQGLIRLIGMSRYGHRKVTIVCDGRGSAESGISMGSARVLFSGHAEEADDVIERLIDRFSHGGGLAVVSSDRRVRAAARRRRSRQIQSGEFLRHLVEDEARPASPARGRPGFAKAVPLDPYSVSHWMAEFGLDPDLGGHEPASDHKPGPSSECALPPVPPAIPPRPIASLTESLKIPDLPKDERPNTARAEPDGPIAADTPAPKPTAGADIDPLIRQALEEWRGRLTLDDLDMRRWLDDIEPL